MRIACPTCNAAYAVPDDQLSEGRVVRCARCGTDWAPLDVVPASEDAPPLPEPMPPEPALPEPMPPLPAAETSPMPIEEEIPLPRPVVLPKPQAKARGPVLLVIAWVLSVGVVVGAVAGLYVARERVMAAWPPSVRLYAGLGLVGRAAPPAVQESERRE